MPKLVNRSRGRPTGKKHHYGGTTLPW